MKSVEEGQGESQAERVLEVMPLEAEQLVLVVSPGPEGEGRTGSWK